MHKFGFRAFSLALILPATILSLVACNLSPLKKGYLHISVVTASAAKTIVPVINPSSYRISFSGSIPVDSIDFATTTTTKELPVGTWSITVLGRDANGVTIAQGSASGIAINSGSTTATSVYLQAVASGTGTISLTVSWTDVSNPVVDGYSMTLNGKAVDSSTGVTFDATARRLVYAASCAAGDYLYVIELKRGTVTVATNSDAIQVYANLPSSGTIVLEQKDFEHKPEAPSGLTAVEVSSHFTLAWTDNSKVETEYQVERGTDGMTFSSLAMGLPANTTSYADTSETLSDQTYYYRIAAVNTFGSSYSDHIACKLSSGNLGLTIVVVSPTNEPISFGTADNIEVAPTATLAVSISESFDSYSWAIDGSIQSGQTANTISIACSTLAPGVHKLVAFVSKNGHLYSKALRFFIYN